MSNRTITATVCISRTDALGQDSQPGGSITIDLPSTFFKDTTETRVWASAMPRGARVFFKLYRHRSLASVLAGRFVRCRAEREYARLLILYRAGVRCCEPLVFARGRSREDGRFELIGTREIPYARQLKAFLAEARDAGRTPDLTGLFATIRSMHTAGVYHGSLTPNNLVVSEEPGRPPEFYVVDLPRGIDFPHSLKGTPMAWYDLVHFVYRTGAEAGRENCLGILDTYGFTPAEKKKFLAFLETYQPTKFLRWRLRNEFTWAARKASPSN